MCLIIHNPKGLAIPDDVLTGGIQYNSDGWGIMASQGGRLRIERGLDEQEFFHVLKDFSGPVAVHFRWATHGDKTVDNVHPFEILGGEYAVMHNGTIDLPQRDKKYSDTWHFCHDILTPLLKNDPGLFGTGYFEEMLRAIVGWNNKLVIMRHDGKSMVVNKKEGAEEGGIWLSSTTWRWGSRWKGNAYYNVQTKGWEDPVKKEKPLTAEEKGWVDQLSRSDPKLSSWDIARDLGLPLDLVYDHIAQKKRDAFHEVLDRPKLELSKSDEDWINVCKGSAEEIARDLNLDPEVVADYLALKRHKEIGLEDTQVLTLEEPKALPAPVPEHYNASLYELSKLRYQPLATFVQTNPYRIAQLIQNFFTR